jgi:gliding motility-associated-like protein
MKRMRHLLTLQKRFLVVAISLLTFAYSASSQTATNAYAGGEITYQMGNGDTLEVTLNYYIHCGGSAPGTNPFLILRNCSGTPLSAKNMGTPTITEVSNTSSTTNCGAGTVTGRRRYQYTTGIDISSELGAACNFYRLTISPNTRNSSENLLSANSQRMWLQADIYVQNDATNSSPTFGAQAIPYVCKNSAVAFSPEVSDVDGDSLVFSLIAAKTGTTTASAITYSSGSGAAPISGISIDAASGLLTFTSPDSGNHQVVILVDEYDRASGNQISAVYRDFQIHVDTNCTNDGPVPSASFSSLTNVNSTVANDTVYLDTNVAASFRLLFTDANGIDSYSSNAVGVLGGNATFNSANSQISWTPSGSDIGIHIVTISAEDNVTPISGKGATTVAIIVRDEIAPFELTGAVTTNATCANPINGSLLVQFTGGTGPFSFQIVGQFTGIDTTQISPQFTNLPSDNYKITMVDSGAGQDTTEIAFVHSILNIPFIINGFTQFSDISCDDACDGSFRVNPNSLGAGGPSNYTYLWSNGQTSRVATDLCGGTVGVTVTDTLGCALTDTVALFEPPVVFANLDSTDSASCNGAADGAVYLSANGGIAASNATNQYIIDQTEGSFEPYPFGEARNVSNYSTVSLGDDAVSGNLNIGFSFDFFGNSFTQFRISSNGFITLGTTNNDDGCCSGDALPTAGTPGNVVAGFWEDLDPDNGNAGTIESYEFGSGANQVRIINFIDVPHFPSGTEVTFQIALYETSNIIQIYGDSLPSDGGQHTQGIENAAGDTAFFVTGRNGANWNVADDYVSFIPMDQDFNYTWSSIGTGASSTLLTAGTYTVTAADDDGCGDTVTFIIEEPAQIDIDTVITQPACAGDSTGVIVASATGGSGGTFTFAWNTGANTATITNIPAGTYTVTATDDTGCEDSLTINLTDPASLGITLTPTDAGCLGGNDGQILAAGTGGTSGTFTYVWSTTSTANPLTGLTAGTYLVTATDGNGCTVVDSADLDQPATAVAVVADSTDESCAGAADGEANAAGTGGTGTITYAWSNGGTTQTITGLTASTYTVTATDANGCAAADTIVVNAPASSVNSSVTLDSNASCFGETDGGLTAVGSGGSGTYTFSWNISSTNATIAGLAAATYSVTVTDANGCTDSASAAISSPPQLFAFTSELNAPTCNNIADGSVQGFGNGGTGAYTYAWSNGATTQIISNLIGGTYSVTVTDANGCTDDEDETISAPNPIVIVKDSLNESCSGSADGEAYIASLSGGSTPFTFIWNTGSTNDTITGLTAGSYTVTVTDSNSCTEEATFTLDSGSGATVSVDSTDITCNGDDDGTATATATGAATITYAWSNGGTTVTISSLATGTYTVTVTDGNGCTTVDSTVVNEPAVLVATASALLFETCTTNDGEATVNFTGAQGTPTFGWSNSATTQTITGLDASTYNVTVTDLSGCTDSSSVVILDTCACSVDAGLAVDAGVSCTGTTNTGALSVSPSGGTGSYTRLWSNGATSVSINNLAAGTYSVIVTDDNGCADTAQVTLSATTSSIASPTILTNDTSLCVGTSLLLQGQSNSTSTWTDTTALLCTNISGGAVSGVFSNVPATAIGNATLSVTGFGDLDDGFLPENIAIIDETSGSVGTYDGSNTQCATATETFTITQANINSWAANNVVSFVFDAGFFVTANSCSGNAYCVQAALTFPTPPDTSYWFDDPLNLDTALAIGFGDTVTVTPATSTSYYYSTFNGVCWSEPDTVDVDTLPSINVSIVENTTISCPGDSASVTASGTGGTGSLSFTWPTGETTATVNLPAGTWCVTVDDAGGTCSDTACVILVDPSTFTVAAAGVDPFCNGGNNGSATATPTGGIGTITYLWSNSGGGSTITGLTADTYFVTATDGNGCTATDSVVINDPALLVASATSTDLDCFGDNDGTTNATSTGGTGTVTFVWSNGSTGSALTGLTADQYSVTVTDANGCTDSTSVFVFEPTLLVANIDSTDSNDCFGAADGVAYASGSGGTTAYTFLWSTGSTSDTTSGLTAGSYTVTITDANGCTDSEIAVITEPATGMTVSITNTDSTSCNNGTDGAASAQAANAQGTVTYAWSNGDAGATTTSGLSAGTYNVTATDASGCTATTTATIEQPDEIILSVSGNDPSCNGEDNGDASVTVTSGGVGAITFVWSNTGSGANLNGLTADTYIVTATDGNGCTATDTIVLTNPTGITATFSGIVESSCTSCTGEATVSATGAATLTYAWPGSQTGTSASGLCDGINVLTITDGNGCLDSFNVAIPSDSADTIFSITGIDPLCNGGCDGEAFTTNSCTGCTFVWTDSASATTVSAADTAAGLCSGTYYVEMTNTGGCSTFDTVTLSDPAGINVPVPSSTDVSCLGGNDGTASATATGGSGTFTFTWSNGATGANIGSLTAGTYTVYASDGNGCSDSNSVVITEPATGLSVVATLDSNVTCNGGNNGGASAVASGGSGTINYTWNGSLNGTPITSLTAGTYVVVVSDAGSCTATDSIDVTEPTAVVGVIDSTTNPTCPGDSNGTAFVSATGGSGTYAFLWPSGNTNASDTGLPDGTYLVTITDANGCEDILSVVITDPAGMTNTFSGITTSSCTVCDGQATTNVTGGNGSNYTFIWGNGQMTSANDSLCAGINGVTITDSLGCTLEDFVPISADGADTVQADSIDATCGSCDGIAFATYNCTNGPCTIEWTTFGSATILGTTDTLDSLCAGVYFAALTNNLGCTNIDQVTVVAPDPIDPNETIADESCSGAGDGSITLNTLGGSGTYTYTWSNSAGNVSANTGLAAGTYTVTIADNAGCDSIAEFVIDAPTGIVLTDLTTDASCFGECDGTITITATGGAGSYTYNWSPIPGNGQGVQAATGLCADDYFVTVTDANSCFVLDTITVAEPTEIVQTFVDVDSAACGVCDGAVTQVVSGGAGSYTYIWNNGDTAASIDTLCFGFYDVTVTDTNGCTAVFGHPVSETDGPEITLSSANTSAQGECDGTATVTIVNSQGTVTYAWSNGDTTATADSLCAGLVIVTVTDVNGCSTVDTITIIEPDLMTISVASTEITCEFGPCDGEASVAVTGGVQPYTYAWSNLSTNDTITGLCAGTYVVTVTDVNGSIAVDSVTLDNPSPFTVTSTLTELACGGTCDGAISLNITGAGIPMILWSTGDTTNSIDSLCPGIYTVTISDTSGCDDSLSFNLLAPPAITLTVDSFTEPDCQIANGSISTTAGGGTGSTYDYLWLDFEFTPLIPTQDSSAAINLLAGIYNVEVTDSNGCKDTFNIILDNNNAPDIALDSIVDVSCFGDCDGSISVTLTGGTTPYTILWSSGGTIEDDSNLCAGPDTIAVADANLCLSVGIYEVETPDELFIQGYDITSANCGSACDGEATIHVRGGSAPFTYSWSNGGTDSTITGLCAGLYDVTVTDANGCSITGAANVAGPQALILVLDSTNDATCTYTGDGNVFITLSGGAPGYTYSWIDQDSNSYANQDLTNVVSGTYMLTITDATGCTISDTFEIDALNFVSVSVDEDIEVCPDSRGITIVGDDSLATSVRWLNGQGIVVSSSKTAVVDALNDTNMYVFEGTNGLCVARDTILLIETDGPGIEAGFDRSIEPGEEVTIGGDPTANNGVEVTWTPDQDITSTTIFNPIVNPLRTTTYYVSGIDNDECFGVDSAVVTVEKIVDPVGGFSPNGDGVNDFFVIDRISKFPDAQVQIFNRWGNLIFTSDKGYTKPWNGKFNGNGLSVGTYYYAIDLNVDGEEIITGPISILK